MKNSLQLNLSQSLKLTPQLQQAIKLLQLSSIELQELIQEAAQENPFLQLEMPEHNDTSESMSIANSPVKSPLKSSYDLENYNKDFENIYKTEESLHSYLEWQVNLIPLSEKDQIITTNIIDSISDDGYLENSLEEILDGLQKHYPETDTKLDECGAMLKLIQNLDPVGCGTTNMIESLKIQLHQFSKETPFLDIALNIIHNHLDLVAKNNRPKLIKITKLSEENLTQALNLIKSLDPKPGKRFSNEQARYITPDVVVKKNGDKWQAYLLSESKPRIKLDDNYINIIQNQGDTKDNEYARTHLQDARWLIKSVFIRNSTLLRVASFIVSYQQDFIENGDISMKPLTLSTIADELGLHESTISRITTEKYLLTPKGVFELKYFLSSHLSTKTGEVVSAKSIQAVIKKIIEIENPTNPLTDAEIKEILFEQGINIARRTVAKYRESAGLTSSNTRKIICKEI